MRIPVLTLVLLVAGCQATPPTPSPITLPKAHDDLPRVLHAWVADLARHPRSHKHPKHHAASAGLIEAHFKSLGLDVRRQKVDRSARGTGNVIARLGQKGGPVVVVGAHYDSAYDTPGADDNASGVAVLLAVAEQLVAVQDTLPHAIELVAWTNEEPPFFRTAFMGSHVHAQQLLRDKADVRAMFTIESVGYFTDEEGSQDFPHPLLAMRYPDVGNFLAVVGQSGDDDAVERTAKLLSVDDKLPIFGGTAPAYVPGVDFSDHLNFWEAGYPGIMLTDTAHLRNHRYHTRDDTADTLDYERMALVVHGVFRLLTAPLSPQP